MDLILWRHAEAHDAQAGEDDLSRRLTPKGERQAERVAQWLNRHLPADARVLVSPAQRTQQTAAALRRHVDTVPALAPGRSVDALLAAAGWPGTGGSVLVVGHQPTLGLTAARLLAHRRETWPVRKGGVIWLRWREREGAPQVVLHAVTGADLL
jgi:phosphohistidine phosphatase